MNESLVVEAIKAIGVVVTIRRQTLPVSEIAEAMVISESVDALTISESADAVSVGSVGRQMGNGRQ